MKKTIALADDHTLLRNGLANLLRDLDYHVLFEAGNGIELQQKLDAANPPEAVLMDINMPQMDGYDTTAWLKKNHPTVKVLALSMYDNDESIIRMLKCGARGYILKDSDPSELRAALHAIMTQGYYHSELVTGKLMHAINQLQEPEGHSLKELLGLSAREMEFLKLSCTELTYKEIADKLFVSPRTVDGYRDALFEKLGIKSRVGLVMFAIKQGIVNV